MTLQLPSPAKVNLFLNVLGKRPDGFHELETIFQPVPVTDLLTLETTDRGISLTCSNPLLPTDENNLVTRAARKFFEVAGMEPSVRIHLEKRIPLAAGLGGGSSNAAQTLLGLNHLFAQPLSMDQLTTIAAVLGSDVVFFLQSGPALATGRGEKVLPVAPFPCLHGAWILLFHPGFGISTPWAYQNLARFPDALQGHPGRAQEFLTRIHSPHASRTEIGDALFNSLEAPALFKFPILAIYQEFLRSNGAWGALMSGSGSTTFAFFESERMCREAANSFRSEFGESGWLETVVLESSGRAVETSATNLGSRIQ